ncbi:MAG: hypothetical protein IJX78_02035 [Bacilli bacterium]|nr:hypothetical protein [Bacilli bacterium]
MKKKIYIYRLFFPIFYSIVLFLAVAYMLILTISHELEIKVFLGLLFLYGLGLLLIWQEARIYILFDYKNKLIKFKFKDFSSKSYIHALDIVDKIDVVLRDHIYLDFVLFLKGGTSQKITFVGTYKETFRLKYNYKRLKRQVDKALKECSYGNKE